MAYLQLDLRSIILLSHYLNLSSDKYGLSFELLCMHCLDFSMKIVAVVGWSEGSVSQSSGSRSEMCWRLPQLCPCLGVFRIGLGSTEIPWLKFSNPTPLDKPAPDETLLLNWPFLDPDLSSLGGLGVDPLA